MDSTDPLDGARAIGLCKQATSDTSWGVIRARFLASDETTLTGTHLLGLGLLDDFGPNLKPREGVRLLGLSSGAARTIDDKGFSGPSFERDLNTAQAVPEGYTIEESARCPGVVTGAPHDSAMVELIVRPPSNPLSFAYDFAFYTMEFPQFMCSPFNDFFVALMSPPPTGARGGNISFDDAGNVVSVNVGFLRVCDPQTASDAQVYDCPLGYGELLGTPFEVERGDGGPRLGASTSWLTTVAPLESPGQPFTLRFAVWDSADAQLDSTVLIDNFRFSTERNGTSTQPTPR